MYAKVQRHELFHLHQTWVNSLFFSVFMFTQMYNIRVCVFHTYAHTLNYIPIFYIGIINPMCLSINIHRHIHIHYICMIMCKYRHMCLLCFYSFLSLY